MAFLTGFWEMPTLLVWTGALRITAPNSLNYEISTKALTKSMDPVWKEPYSQDIIRNQSQLNPIQLNSIQQVVTRAFVLLVSLSLLL